MKITLKDIKRIIKEEVALMHAKDPNRFLHGEEGHPADDEAYMVKIQMHAIKQMAEEVCDMLELGDQLPAWLQSHVAVAHENLQQAHGYLVGDSVIDSKMQESKKLIESHKRITQNEIEAWKRGDWGYVAEADHGMMPGRDDKFMHPTKPPGMDRPMCPGCNKMMSPKEKSKFETQGGQGYPAVCEECAELEARP